MCPRLSANYVSCCPPNMAQVSVWADNLQKALLGIKKKYGKNAILKGTNFLDGATMRERNKQIGGHKES